MSRRIFLSMGLAVAAMLALLATPANADPPGNADRFGNATRDPSGLIVVAAPEGAPPGDLEVDVPTELEDAYGVAQLLSEEYPDDFGFPTIDSANSKVSLPVVGARGRQVRDSVAAGKANPRAVEAILNAGRPSVKTAPRGANFADLLTGRTNLPESGRSRRDVERTKDGAFDLAIGSEFDAEGAWQSEVDPLTGLVILRVEQLTPNLAAALVSQFGTEDVVVRIENRPDTHPNSRSSDTSPFYGGAAINVPAGGCTDAFSWYSGSTNMMLTAGHCISTGGSVSTPATSLGSVASGSRESWTDGTGTVYLTGQSTYRGDIALATINSGKSSAARMYRGGTTSSTSAIVGEMWSRRAQSGDQYCTGGSRSGEICDWTVSSVGVNHRYSSGEVVRTAVVSRSKQGWCTRPGDSGGPVYTVRSDGKIAAKGIISGGGGGGSDYYGGLFDQCFQVFTDIYDPYYGFPGFLRTG